MRSLLASALLCTCLAMSEPDPDALSAEIDIHAIEDPSAGPLLLPGRKFPLDFAGGQFTLHGAPLRILEASNASAGTGFTIWDGAVVLSKFLELHPFLTLRRSLLELGAGTGMVSIAASTLGATSVICTDLQYACEHAQRNVELNAAGLKGDLSVTPLDWNSPSSCTADLSGVELILGADVVWLPGLVRPLINALEYIHAAVMASGRPHGPVVYIAHQTRAHATDALLFDGLREGGWVIHTVPRPLHHPGFNHPDISIYRISKHVVEGDI